ncbi:hypothetical protein TNCV_3962261 [Trichonephila clavipes]|nr:hypothetical protein TNCV_3962261 [Trichonephila clavipes]
MAASSFYVISTPLAHADNQGEGHPRRRPYTDLFKFVVEELFRMKILFPVFVGCGSPVVKVSDNGIHVMSSSPVSLKTRRVG